MLVSMTEGENFTLAMDADEAAALVEDIATLAQKTGVYDTTWQMAETINKLWWYAQGCSIGDEIEEMVGLEEEG